jgi:predicted nuclease with TOPRIM domain
MQALESQFNASRTDTLELSDKYSKAVSEKAACVQGTKEMEKDLEDAVASLQRQEQYKVSVNRKISQLMSKQSTLKKTLEQQAAKLALLSTPGPSPVANIGKDDKSA